MGLDPSIADAYFDRLEGASDDPIEQNADRHLLSLPLPGLDWSLLWPPLLVFQETERS